MNCQACKDLKWILFILAWNHLVAVRFLSTVVTVSAQRVNIDAEFDEQPVQFMIRGDLKNVECIIPLIHHMYRSFLRVVHLKSLLIFGSRLKRRVPFSLGLITQTSYMYMMHSSVFSTSRMEKDFNGFQLLKPSDSGVDELPELAKNTGFLLSHTKK